MEYNPHEEGTPDRPYGFVYHITIHNDSPRVVTIKGRKWVVTNADTNSKLVIEGDGVVGECPRLTPGTQFHYQSYHLIESDSVAEGAYLGPGRRRRAGVHPHSPVQDGSSLGLRLAHGFRISRRRRL